MNRAQTRVDTQAPNSLCPLAIVVETISKVRAERHSYFVEKFIKIKGSPIVTVLEAHDRLPPGNRMEG